MAKIPVTTGSRRIDTASRYPKKAPNRQAKKSNTLIESASTGRCMLLELPKELQLMILAMLVVFCNSTHIITALDNPTFKALRSVNHEMRSTVLDLFFGKNTFLIGHPGTTARILRGANATLAALVQDLRFDYGMTTEDLYVDLEDRYALFRMFSPLRKCVCRLGPTRDWRSIFGSARDVHDLNDSDEDISFKPGARVLRMLKMLKLTDSAELVVAYSVADGRWKRLKQEITAAIQQVISGSE